MQIDFHYYATYCAAYLAGYSHEESLSICRSSQFTDCCSATLLSGVGAPLSAATTQLHLEMMNAKTDILSLQDITRIWASFHFLPFDLNADVKKGNKLYKDKYRLLCGPDSDLILATVELAKERGLEAAGIAMHVLADTWAHRYFAGTPSLVINNTDYDFYELLPNGDSFTERKVTFRNNPSAADDLEKGIYTNTVFQLSETSVMCLGHGRAGHLPDYCFMRYRYLPAWADYEAVVKDNPAEYYNAFCQMVRALRYLREEIPAFEKGVYDTKIVSPWEDEIRQILLKRQPDACADFKALGEKLSGTGIPDFDQSLFTEGYRAAAKEEKDDTLLGRYIIAALAQKSMVTNRIYKSGNLLAGYSVDYAEKGFKGIKDFMKLVEIANRKSEKSLR